jgi:hypothetical protein
MNKAPELVMIPTPCPECGAIDMDEANEKCRPRTDETGERLCGGEFNDDGVSVQPSPESLAAFDKHWADLAREDDDGGWDTKYMGIHTTRGARSR